MPALSARNPRVAALRRLVRARRARDDARRFVIEGPTLVAEALASGITIDELYVTPDTEVSGVIASAVANGAIECWSLDSGVLASVASTESPQPMMATARFVDVSIGEALGDGSSPAQTPMVVIAAGVGEPGNLGTMVRSALGAGATALVCCEASADLYNPKVVRAAAGALFRLPVVRDCTVGELFDALHTRAIAIVGLDGAAAMTIDGVDWRAPMAIVVGNEAHGLSDAVRERLESVVAIPLAGGLESLNAAAAVTVTVFEAARQRRRVSNEGLSPMRPVP